MKVLVALSLGFLQVTHGFRQPSFVTRMRNPTLATQISIVKLRGGNQYGQNPPGQYQPDQWEGESIGMQNESVEERLEAWRQQQQYKYEHQTPLDAASPREEDGKMKLLASVSKGSIGLFFFILMWRSVHHYELADQSFSGATRLFFVIPPVLLFIGNMAGMAGSVMSSGSMGKKRMKAILNLNKLMEMTLMAYNVMRLVLVPSKLVLREIYVGRTLSNFLFLVQCQLFTKVTWNAGQVKASTAAETTYGTFDDSQDYAYNEDTYQSYDGYSGSGQASNEWN